MTVLDAPVGFAESTEPSVLHEILSKGLVWLSNNNVRREQLGTNGRTLDETNRAIVIDPAQIRHIAAWHVAIFCGRGRENALPLIHRSAPVSRPQEFRLRLCIDLPSDCGC